MKNGPGKFFYLDTGQLLEGVWKDDVAKCGQMIDFGREGAPEPTEFPIPEVRSKLSILCLKFILNKRLHVDKYPFRDHCSHVG